MKIGSIFQYHIRLWYPPYHPHWGGTSTKSPWGSRLCLIAADALLLSVISTLAFTTLSVGVWIILPGTTFAVPLTTFIISIAITSKITVVAIFIFTTH